MSEHTPGPWRVEGETHQTWLVASHRQAAAIAAGCINEADARLIASAPEMLEALRDLVLAESLPQGYANRSVLIDAARAAINKATAKE